MRDGADWSTPGASRSARPFRGVVERASGLVSWPVPSFSEGVNGSGGEVPTEAVVLTQERGTELQDRLRTTRAAPVRLLPPYAGVEFAHQRLHQTARRR